MMFNIIYNNVQSHPRVIFISVATALFFCVVLNACEPDIQHNRYQFTELSPNETRLEAVDNVIDPLLEHQTFVANAGIIVSAGAIDTPYIVNLLVQNDDLECNEFEGHEVAAVGYAYRAKLQDSETKTLLNSSTYNDAYTFFKNIPTYAITEKLTAFVEYTNSSGAVVQLFLDSNSWTEEVISEYETRVSLKFKRSEFSIQFYNLPSELTGKLVTQMDEIGSANNSKTIIINGVVNTDSSNGGASSAQVLVNRIPDDSFGYGVVLENETSATIAIPSYDPANTSCLITNTIFSSAENGCECSDSGCSVDVVTGNNPEGSQINYELKPTTSLRISADAPITGIIRIRPTAQPISDENNFVFTISEKIPIAFGAYDTGENLGEIAAVNPVDPNCYEDKSWTYENSKSYTQEAHWNWLTNAFLGPNLRYIAGTCKASNLDYGNDTAVKIYRTTIAISPKNTITRITGKMAADNFISKVVANGCEQRDDNGDLYQTPEPLGSPNIVNNFTQLHYFEINKCLSGIVEVEFHVVNWLAGYLHPIALIVDWD